MKIGNTNNTQAYFNLAHCVFSPLAINDKGHFGNHAPIDNSPGTDRITNPLLTEQFIIGNLNKLFKNCINPIVNKFGSKSIALTSVYRNKTLNNLMGGGPNSQHIFGYAADIVHMGETPTSFLFNWIIVNIPKFHQVIWEYPERGNYYSDKPTFSWIHISYIENNNYREKSVSSEAEAIHLAYKDNETYNLGNYTHGIAGANYNLANPDNLPVTGITL